MQQALRDVETAGRCWSWLFTCRGLLLTGIVFGFGRAQIVGIGIGGRACGRERIVRHPDAVVAGSPDRNSMLAAWPVAFGFDFFNNEGTDLDGAPSLSGQALLGSDVGSPGSASVTTRVQRRGALATRSVISFSRWSGPSLARSSRVMGVTCACGLSDHRHRVLGAGTIDKQEGVDCC